MPDTQELIALCAPFLAEIKDMPPGDDMERWLNATHGVGSPFYEELARLARAGVEAGWAANIEVEGPKYRRSRLCEPSPETAGFSINCVYIDSTESTQGNPEDSFRGAYHAHPAGEINIVIPLDEGAALNSFNGWCHGGWTAGAPETHHYPEVKGGALITVYFLPGGQIRYDISPPNEPKAAPAA